MNRILEPEVMDGADQAEAYAGADFVEVDSAFVKRFQALFPDFRRGVVGDLGCGPAAIARRLCARLPEIRVTGVDASPAMLRCARAALQRTAHASRIDLIEAYLPSTTLAEGMFDAVVSNSLLHHLPDPSVLWTELARTGRSGAPVLVVDLLRPPGVEEARVLVDLYAAGEPEVLRHDFFQSLCAAFTVDEIHGQLNAAGLHLAVERISDRHVAVHGRLA